MYVCREVHSVTQPLVAGQVSGGGGASCLLQSSKQGRPGGARGHRGSGAAGSVLVPQDNQYPLPGGWGSTWLSDFEAPLLANQKHMCFSLATFKADIWG